MATAIRNNARSAAPAAAGRMPGPGVWRLEPAPSEVRFQVRAMGGLIRTSGRFKVLDGTITVDEAGRVSGRLRADARSLETGIGMRDRHLRSADFFDAGRHPYLEFAVRELATDGAGHLHVTGDLVVRGVVTPLAAEATVQEAGGGMTVAADAALDHAAVGRALKRGGVIKGPAHLTARLRFSREPKAELGRYVEEHAQ